jgi:glycosyltransferase involved in cell wall biosynthesis
VLYLGTQGMAHALQHVLEAAREMMTENKFMFVFVGEGAEKARLKALADAWKLSNVQFIDQQPKARVPRFYAACDLGIVSLRDTPLFQEVLPSKIFEYLGMERPIVLMIGGEARRVVAEAGAGVYVEPGNVAALVHAIRRLSNEREKLKQMGKAGRAYVLRHFDRRQLAHQYFELLKELCPNSTGAETTCGV